MKLFYYQQYHENGQYIIQIIKIDYVINLKKLDLSTVKNNKKNDSLYKIYNINLLIFFEDHLLKHPIWMKVDTPHLDGSRNTPFGWK